MHIPEVLITYTADDWLPQVEDGISFPQLRAREKWRQAQDTWADDHGLDRTEFERLMRQQKQNDQEVGGDSKIT